MDRAQSEVIGVILLTAVILLTVGAFGAFYLPTLDDGGDRPLFSIEGDTDPPNVTITHAGGDSVGAGELRLSIEVNGSQVASPTLDREFTPGETWSVNVSNYTTVSRGSVVGVTLYHLPSESRLYSEEWAVGEEWTRTATPTPTPTETPTPPTVTVDSPNGGETLRGGETYTVEWSASDDDSGVSGVEVAYSTDNGSSWTTVATDPSGGSYDWSVPPTTTQDARVRVTATDGAGNSASATSGPFTIDADDPTINSVSPNASAPTYTQSGQNVTVSWNASDATTGVSSVGVSIENDTATVANTTATAATGSTTLTVPDGTAEGNYSIVIEAVDAVGNAGSSARTDAVVVDDTAPTLELRVRDNGNRPIFFLWEESYSFEWFSSDENPYDATITVSREGTEISRFTRASGTEEYENYVWDSGGTYRFRFNATDRAGNSRTVEIIDDSDGEPNRRYEVENGWMVVEDGGSSSPASLDWSTAADWDNATANGISHDGATPGTLRLGAGTSGSASGSLLVYYPLDGNGDAEDATGNGRGATNDGATTGVSGISGTNAYEFDGDGDALEDADAENYLNGLSDVSASMWIQSDTTNSDNGVFFTGTPSGSDDRLGVRYDAQGYSTGGSNLIKYSVSADGTELNEETVSDTQTTDWQHLVLTWTADGDLKLYIDGQEVDSPNDPTAGPGPLRDVSTLLVGKGAKGGANSGWDGKIDEFRVYDRTLTADEAAALHSAASDGEAVTATKTFESAVDPSTLSLANVSANVPTGTDATVYVQSDPDGDGDFEEESAPVTLNSSASDYGVDTSGMSPSDTYRLRIVLGSGDVTETPTVDGIELRSD